MPYHSHQKESKDYDMATSLVKKSGARRTEFANTWGLYEA